MMEPQYLVEKKELLDHRLGLFEWRETLLFVKLGPKGMIQPTKLEQNVVIMIREVSMILPSVPEGAISAEDGVLSGWIMIWKMRESGTLCGCVDKVWLSPTRHKIRSMRSVQAFFEAAGAAEKRVTTQPKDPVIRAPYRTYPLDQHAPFIRPLR
jgi:hypothetical protein